MAGWVLCLCWLIFLSLWVLMRLPGEFTKRAFLNNKISLAEAEAVVDLIDSYDQDGVVLSSNTLQVILQKRFWVSQML